MGQVPSTVEGAIEAPGDAPSAGNLTPPLSSYATGGEAPEGSGGAQVVEFASPPTGGNDDYLDADHDEDAPLRFRKIDDILGPASLLGFAP